MSDIEDRLTIEETLKLLENFYSAYKEEMEMMSPASLVALMLGGK